MFMDVTNLLQNKVLAVLKVNIQFSSTSMYFLLIKIIFEQFHRLALLHVSSTKVHALVQLLEYRSYVVHKIFRWIKYV